MLVQTQSVKDTCSHFFIYNLFLNPAPCSRFTNKVNMLDIKSQKHQKSFCGTNRLGSGQQQVSA